jgi:general stress protein CsbA
MTESVTLLYILSSYIHATLLTALCLQAIVSKGYAQAFWTAYREIIRKKLGFKLVEEVRSRNMHTTLSAPVCRVIDV